MTTPRGSAAEREPLSRAFYDIAQFLESAEDADARVIRVLEQLQSLVPYSRCAVLQAPPGGERKLVTLPDMPPAERAALTTTIGALLAQLVEEHAQPAEQASRPGVHLAVPLIGLDEVVGVLFVQGADRDYQARHVRRLSVVAAKLAAYFTMLRASALEGERMRQLDEARQGAERANRAKDEFLALISHELRTPLNTILGWADALRSKDTGEADRTRAFEAIERSVRAQAKLIEDLLDLACVSNATLRLDLRAVEPAKLIQATVRALRPRAEQKSIRLEVCVDPSAMPLVADPNRLRQIVANLIANAIEYTPKGGRVEVRLERADTHARIRVIDSGSGISPEVMPTVFERFRQADGSTTRHHGGLGVGLALVKDLVDLHGGRVRAESPGEAKGAIFTVELPLATAAASEPAQPKREAPGVGLAADGSGAVGLSTVGGASSPPRTLAGIRVLVVDDDKDMSELLQFVLESHGAAVTVAGSAAEALAALECSMPHVLLSDIAMPNETGYELMRKIVARAGRRAPPAAALSAYSQGHDVERALAAGFRMQLDKPVDPETLIAAVVALARGDRATDARRDRVEGSAR
jgi:signal transduction histidine kinase/ActR/RegA family two-component response regulator